MDQPLYILEQPQFLDRIARYVAVAADAVAPVLRVAEPAALPRQAVTAEAPARRIEHHVGRARGKQEVTVAIAPGSHESGLREQTIAGRAVLITREIRQVAREHRGFGELRGGAAVNGPAVQRRARPIAQHELTEDRLVNAAEHRLTLVEQRDKRTEERHARDE